MLPSQHLVPAMVQVLSAMMANTDKVSKWAMQPARAPNC